MKDIDRANILDGLVIEIVFGKVEKSGVEKPSFRGGDIIISPPGTDRVNALISTLCQVPCSFILDSNTVFDVQEKGNRA